jgi:hypothetical protein
LVADVQAHHDKEMAEVAAGFAADKPNLAGLAAHLVAARYYRRVLEEAGVHDEEDTAK